MAEPSDAAARPRLLGAGDVRRLADEYDIRPTKKRGQNFVIDANTVRRIVATAGVTGADRVLEIGPGLGSLTLALLAEADSVVAVEIDSRLAQALPRTVEEFAPKQAERLTVVGTDAMSMATIPGDPPTALVANLPYNVAVPVLLHLLDHFPTIERVLVMVQSEVADRLAAAPGSKIYGIPSAKAAWYGEVRRAGHVGTTVFWPAPRVESGLVSITRREPPATTASRERVFEVIDAAFAQRRKTLRAALAELAGSGATAERALVAARIDPTLRGERLSIADFARVAETLDQVSHP